MNSSVYPDRAAAVQACRSYMEEFYALQERYHITESCDDSCVQTYTHVEYYNEDGTVSTYTHW
tara:strand:+ start:8112 stop:8300 length:189 start_codon:yes stop_codon:yes gene_type:complete